jgi:hypothetical protein
MLVTSLFSSRKSATTEQASHERSSYSLPMRAQGLVEYGLIVALVAILAIAAIIIFGPAVSNFLAARG